MNRPTPPNRAPANPDSFALAGARLAAQRPLHRPRLQQIASHLRTNNIELAVKELAKQLDRHPDDADAMTLMAMAQIRLGRRKEAAALLARCLELAPDFAAARFDYANLLFQLNKFAAALHEVDRLLEADNRNPLFLYLKASILEIIGENEQSLAICEQLATENPGRAKSWVTYGNALRASGFQEKGIAAYRKAIGCDPSYGLAWWSLANLKTGCFGAADIDAMQEQLKRPDIAADNRVALQFSLGKAYEDLQAFDTSFEHYAKANAAKRLGIGYDPDTATARVAAFKTLFTPAFLLSRSDAGCKAPDPIFVLGPPRSGSTLIEQILASHSAIEATAELPYIADLAGRLESPGGSASRAEYPGILEALDAARLTALGEAYLESTRVHRRLGRPFFIDKSPSNYFFAGLIHLILPNAKIIDARRHPAACCLSIFKQYFSKNNLRLTELGRFYRDYVALMAHVDAVLPGRIHRVIYEDMVADPEAEIRRLLDHLGLPFEENCLRFYENDRAVLTPSSEQVRRPMSRAAIDHWRHYEPWLGPLIDSLGSALTAYPSVPEELR
jgi:tetratricopeptide (TPR) repeat protein